MKNVKTVVTICFIGAHLIGGGRLLAAKAVKDYPTKPVRLIVPFAAGGGTDFLARVVGDKLSGTLEQSFVIDNRTGAGSSIGTAIAAKAAPDGYTIVLSSISLAFNATLYKNLPYDTLKDLTAISLVAMSPNVLVVHPAVPAQSVRELVRLAKAKQLNYGSGGVGGSAHICTEYFLSVAGIRIQHVPYRGAAPALSDLVAGNLDLAMVPITPVPPLVKAGRLRALGVTTARRTPILPDVPTIAESGLPGFEYVTWYGLLAPAGTPRPIIRKLNDEVRKALQLPDVLGRMHSQGVEPAWSTAEEFGAFIKSEIGKWGEVIRAIGNKPS